MKFAKEPFNEANYNKMHIISNWNLDTSLKSKNGKKEIKEASRVKFWDDLREFLVTLFFSSALLFHALHWDSEFRYLILLSKKKKK